ncbi:MAG: hypothetical protein ACLFPQ_01830 [Candidatus Woesearchaeota archaeon]
MKKNVLLVVKVLTVMLVLGGLFMGSTALAGESVPEVVADGSKDDGLFQPLSTCKNSCGWCPNDGACDYALRCC